MKASQAIDYLQSHCKPDEEIVMIVLLEAEIREVTGPRYDIAPLASLVSRTPSWPPALEQHYWYNKRLTFKRLLEAGIDQLEKNAARDRIQQANDKLFSEMRLINMVPSVDFELRPMAIFHDTDFLAVVNGNRRIIHANCTVAEVLTVVNDMNTDAGDSVFLEGWTLVAAEEDSSNTRPLVHFHFGS